MTIRPFNASRAAVVLALLAAPAFAQTAPPPDASVAAPGAAARDQPVQLNEFQVSEQSSNAYIASETMTGSRINTKIIDLPYSIVNLTHEFFKDYNIEVLDENMTYIGGLTGINIGGSFNLRGFSSTSQLRDGFYRLGRYGLSNIQEVEIIRGPEAAIYGRSSPGGMINFISLPAEKQDQQQLTLTDGGYQQGMANLYMTGALDKSASTYYVLNLNQTDRSFPGGDSHIRNNEDFLSIEHDFSSTSHLKLSAEYFLQIQHAPQSAPPIISQTIAAVPGNTATTSVVGYDTGLATINPYGPVSELNRGSDTFSGSYDKEFNDVWSIRFGAYRFGARRWDFNQNTGWGAITLPAAGSTAAVTTTRGSLPSRGEIMEDGGGFQQDIVAHNWLFGHTVESKALLTVDFNDYYRWDPTWEYGANTDPAVVAWAAATSGRVVTLVPGMVNGKMTLVPSSGVTYWSAPENPSNLVLFAPGGNSITGGPALNGGTLTRRRTSSLGGNLREQLMAFDSRLILYAGLRNDNVLFSQRDYTVAFPSVGFGNTFAPGTGGANQPGGSVVRRYEHQNKPNEGFSYNLLPKNGTNPNELHVYGSYSTAYFVDQTSRPSVIASPTYAPFTAKGYDYGIKGSFLNSNLNFTLGGYYDKEYNVLVTDRVETPPGSGTFIDVPEQDGNQLVRGFEADISYVVTHELTAGVSYGYVNAIYTNFGTGFPEAVGRSAQNITPQNGGAYLKYNVDSGMFRGLYFNALTTYVAKTPTQTPVAGDTVNTLGIVTASTGLYKVQLPSFTLWTFALHYDWRLNARWDQDMAITLNNAFDKVYLKTSALAGDRRNVLFSYTLRHAGW